MPSGEDRLVASLLTLIVEGWVEMCMRLSLPIFVIAEIHQAHFRKCGYPARYGT